MTILIIIIFIFIGFFIWFGNLGFLNLSRDWPLILIIIGLLGIISALRRGRKSRIIRDLEKGKISVGEAEEKLKRNS
ncbi:hypothetical protein JXB22_08680 [candidate division WOR-3 bacterium]|nr:hypothetical protein [candidate division WOR-3 bacterium]